MVWPPIASGRCLLRGRADCRRGLFGGRLTARAAGYGSGGEGGKRRRDNQTPTILLDASPLRTPPCRSTCQNWLWPWCASTWPARCGRRQHMHSRRHPLPLFPHICRRVCSSVRSLVTFCSFPNHQVPRALSFPITATTAAAPVVDLYILPTMLAVPMLWFIIATPNPHP